MPYELPPITPAPVIDAYKPGIDMTLVRENLKLTHEERLISLIALNKGADALKAAGVAARRKRRQHLQGG